MGDKTARERSRKSATGATNGVVAPMRDAPSGAEEFIARHLKAMYDDVLAQPVPERLLELLGRLDDDASKK